MSCNLFSNKISTGSRDARNIAAYLAATGDNELAPIILGDIDIVKTNDQRSQLYGHKSSHVHFQLTSKDDLNEQELRKYIDEVFSGYSIDPKNHPYIISVHQKTREDGSGADRHYHLVVAYTGLDGKTLNANESYVKNEYISRRVEMVMGRDLGNGKFSKAVYDYAVKNGKFDLAQAITDAGILDLPRPSASMSKQDNQIAKRTGIDLKSIKSALAVAKDFKHDQQLSRIAKAIVHNGITIGKGDKPHVITVIGEDGNGKKEILGSLNRWSGLKITAQDRDEIFRKLERQIARHSAEKARQHGTDASSELRAGKTENTRASAKSAVAGASSGKPEAGRDQDGHDEDSGHNRRGRETGYGEPEPDARDTEKHGSDGRGHAEADRDNRRSDEHNQRARAVTEHHEARDSGPTRDEVIEGFQRLTEAAQLKTGAMMYGDSIRAGYVRPTFSKMASVDTRPAGSVPPRRGARYAPAQGSPNLRDYGGSSGYVGRTVDATKDGLAALNAANESLARPGM